MSLNAVKVLVLVDLQVERQQLEGYKCLLIETHSAGSDLVFDSKVVLLAEEVGIVDVFVVWDL